MRATAFREKNPLDIATAIRRDACHFRESCKTASVDVRSALSHARFGHGCRALIKVSQPIAEESATGVINGRPRNHRTPKPNFAGGLLRTLCSGGGVMEPSTIAELSVVLFPPFSPNRPRNPYLARPLQSAKTTTRSPAREPPRANRLRRASSPFHGAWSEFHCLAAGDLYGVSTHRA